jgi:hypothetical protein
MILSNGLLSASQINSLYTFDNLLNASQIKGNFTKNLIGGSLGNENLLFYIQTLINSFKTRVANEVGAFEAEDCLFANLTTLDDYQVDTNAQIVRDYATRVRANGGIVDGFENVITSIKTLNNLDLYDKASLSLFPSGFKNGTIFSLQPESIINNDLIVNGNFSQNETNWTKIEPINSTVTFTNNQLTLNRASSSNDPSVRNIGIGIKGKTYKITFEVISATVLSNNVGVSIGGNIVYLFPTISSVGIKEIIITAAETSSITIHHGGGGPSIIVLDNISAKEYLSADFSFNRSSTSSRTNRLGLIETAAINIPTLNYPILGNAPELLLEPQRTNLVRDSSNLKSGNWTKVQSGVTVVDSSVLSPNNVDFSEILNVNVSSGNTFIRQEVYASTTLNTSNSVFVKKLNTRYFAIRNAGPGGPHDVFDFDTETFINRSGGILSFQSFANGWYRVNSVKTSTDTNVFLSFFPAVNDSGLEYTTVAINVSVYIWGAQAEIGFNVTSFIPTTTSAVTRVSPNNIILSDLITKGIASGNQGTIFLKLGLVSNDPASAILLNLSINSTAFTSDRFQILTQNGNSRIRATVNNVSVFDFTNSGFQINNTTIVITYLNGVYKLFTNGVLRFTSSSVTQIAYTSVQLTDQNAGGSITSLRSIKSLLLYNTALTDAECVTLTTS